MSISNMPNRRRLNALRAAAVLAGASTLGVSFALAATSGIDIQNPRQLPSRLIADAGQPTARQLTRAPRAAGTLVRLGTSELDLASLDARAFGDREEAAE